MSRIAFIISLIALSIASINAFAPSTPLAHQTLKTSPTVRNMGFGLPDEDTKPLTRDNEPEEFFSTNTDKMTDEEKIPIAIAGFAFVSLPFIAGLIALYAAK